MMAMRQIITETEELYAFHNRDDRASLKQRKISFVRKGDDLPPHTRISANPV